MSYYTADIVENLKIRLTVDGDNNMNYIIKYNILYIYVGLTNESNIKTLYTGFLFLFLFCFIQKIKTILYYFNRCNYTNRIILYTAFILYLYIKKKIAFFTKTHIMCIIII